MASAARALGSSSAAVRAADFPDVEVLHRAPGTAPGLLLVTPYYSPPEQGRRPPERGRPALDLNVRDAFEEAGDPSERGRLALDLDVRDASEEASSGLVSYIAMLDDDGVPHFHRRSWPPAHNFRWHEQARLFSYHEAAPNRGGDVVLLDEQLNEVGRVNTVGGLAPARMHDFLITPEGNHLFLTNNPAVRDLSRYPAREGQPTPSSAQATHDDIIQEVTPDGREVFCWNAYDHLKLSDCAAWRQFPEEYSKLNSLDLDGEDNLIAGFRGCSLALKIERLTGRVLWQLGGSDPAAPDARDPRRPTFQRPWFRPAGDPRGGFCAQHSVLEPAPGRILMFDNGQCADDDRAASRVVEYRLTASAHRSEGGAPSLQESTLGARAPCPQNRTTGFRRGRGALAPRATLRGAGQGWYHCGQSSPATQPADERSRRRADRFHCR